MYTNNNTNYSNTYNYIPNSNCKCYNNNNNNNKGGVRRAVCVERGAAPRRTKK